MTKRVPRLRSHNPEGGSFKRTEEAHALSKDKKANDIYERMARKKKVSFRDLSDLINLELGED